MKLTAESALSRYVRVRLNDADITNDCRAADEEEGEAVLVIRDSLGRLLWDETINDVPHRTVKGKVQISLKNYSPEWAQALFEHIRA